MFFIGSEKHFDRLRETLIDQYQLIISGLILNELQESIAQERDLKLAKLLELRTEAKK